MIISFSFLLTKESQNEMYQHMYQYMVDNKDDVLTSSNDEGIARVYSSGEGKYYR